MQIITNLTKSDFFRNLATMMTGTIVGQVITLAAMPILSRMYGVEYQTLMEMIMKAAIKRTKG
jgi:O-antigen/teichoic acid export membrane protein